MHDNELYFYLDPANIKQCLTEATGSEYNGHKNTTKSGLTCQAWGSHTPVDYYATSISKMAMSLLSCM
jgi:predicted transcriptional regulator with HTH domain